MVQEFRKHAKINCVFAFQTPPKFLILKQSCFNLKLKMLLGRKTTKNKHNSIYGRLFILWYQMPNSERKTRQHPDQHHPTPTLVHLTSPARLTLYAPTAT